MTPERLAFIEDYYTHQSGVAFSHHRGNVLDLIAHIRDLEAAVIRANLRASDEHAQWSGVAYKAKEERAQADGELAEAREHIRDLEAQLAAAREKPSIDDCLYHRCVEHWTVPGRNTTASSNGAECGACIERDWRSAFKNYATHHNWCASGHGGMHVLGSPGACDCGRDARLATATPPSPEVG